MKKAALIIIAITLSITAYKDPGSPGPNTQQSDPNTVVQPTASPSARAIISGTSVTLSTTTTDAEIWYTTNGNTPAKNETGSTKYTSPVTINPSTTLKAIAVKDGMNNSSVLSATYSDPRTDFTQQTNAEKLFGSYLTGKDYSIGQKVLDLMNDRWTTASTGTGTLFYPISSGATENGTGIAAGISAKKTLIFSGDPKMAFIIPNGNSNLFIWGESTGNGSNPQEIKFWIAVIGTDGKGWISSELSRSYVYSPSNARWDKDISLSSLTGGYITNQSQLGSYQVFIIVKSTTDLLSNNWGDNLNTITIPINFSNRNVIKVYPTPY